MNNLKSWLLDRWYEFQADPSQPDTLILWTVWGVILWPFWLICGVVILVIVVIDGGFGGFNG